MANARPVPTAMQITNIHTAAYGVVELRPVVLLPDGDSNPVVALQDICPVEKVVRHAQVYERDLEKIFPIRSPGNPSHVHERYVDPQNPRGCAPGVQVLKVELEPKTKDMLIGKLRRNFHDYDITRQNLVSQLIKSCKADFEATLQGNTPPSAARAKVVKLSAAQCLPGEEALHGQYGVVPMAYMARAQPSIKNGHIVCIYAGAKVVEPPLSVDERGPDWPLYEKALGAQAERLGHEYGTTINRVIDGVDEVHSFLPYGGGNMGQFMNTVLAPGKGHQDGKLVSDEHNCNALLMPLKVRMLDKDGVEHDEKLYAVVQHKPIEQGGQIRLYYGPEYEMADNPVALDGREPRTQQVVIKEEPGSWVEN